MALYSLNQSVSGITLLFKILGEKVTSDMCNYVSEFIMKLNLLYSCNMHEMNVFKYHKNVNLQLYQAQ